MHPIGKQLRLYLCDDGQDQGGGLRWGQEVGSAGVGSVLSLIHISEPTRPKR